MANKLYAMELLTEEVAKDVAANPQEWMRFLNTASRLYRYTFPEQLLIYAQRPGATAVASMEIWNQKMYRWIKKGSKGISEMLRMEAVQALEDRKSRARQLGEEAGTRLLIPMLLMLIIVITIVVVPAFLSIQV